MTAYKHFWTRINADERGLRILIRAVRVNPRPTRFFSVVFPVLLLLLAACDARQPEPIVVTVVATPTADPAPVIIVPTDTPTPSPTPTSSIASPTSTRSSTTSRTRRSKHVSRMRSIRKRPANVRHTSSTVRAKLPLVSLGRPAVSAPSAGCTLLRRHEQLLVQ